MSILRVVLSCTTNQMSNRSSAVDMVGGATSRRGSYRTEDTDSTPQISGLSVDEDRPIRRRGSQL